MTAVAATTSRSVAVPGETPAPAEFVRNLKRLLKEGSAWDVAAYYDRFGAAVGPALTERQRTAVGNIMHVVDAATDWQPSPEMLRPPGASAGPRTAAGGPAAPDRAAARATG